VAEGSDIGRLATEARHEGETIGGSGGDTEQNRRDEIATSPGSERGVMKKARGIAVARALRERAAAARAIWGGRRAHGAGQMLIVADVTAAAEACDFGERPSLHELRVRHRIADRRYATHVGHDGFEIVVRELAEAHLHGESHLAGGLRLAGYLAGLEITK